MQSERISIILLNIKTAIFNKFKQFFEKKTPQEIDYTADRKYVGNIIISVLMERINVQRALLAFPKGCADDSIRAAWHALCHYEADEDMRLKDVEYNNVQVELLEMIAFAFKDGNPVPQNIIDSYKPYYEDNPIFYESGFKGFLKKLFRFVNF